jgi:hypothetical protein
MFPLPLLYSCSVTPPPHSLIALQELSQTPTRPPQRR